VSVNSAFFSQDRHREPNFELPGVMRILNMSLKFNTMSANVNGQHHFLLQGECEGMLWETNTHRGKYLKKLTDPSPSPVTHKLVTFSDIYINTYFNRKNTKHDFKNA
jgi:hypothetical protein